MIVMSSQDRLFRTRYRKKFEVLGKVRNLASRNSKQAPEKHFVRQFGDL